MAYTEENGRDRVCSWREHRNTAMPGNEKWHSKVMNPMVAASRRPRVMTSVAPGRRPRLGGSGQRDDTVGGQTERRDAPAVPRDSGETPESLYEQRWALTVRIHHHH